MSKKGNNIEISLTDFVDFVSKTGSTKLTKVREVKSREAYSPATDFYKALREGMINIHAKNLPLSELDEILKQVKDPKKIRSYTDCIKGYKKYLGRKKLEWFDPPSKLWKEGNLIVRVNPELGIDSGKEMIVIKLYFKAETLSKSKIDQVLTLMEHVLRSDLGDEESDVLFGVLDVQAGKLFLNKNRSTGLLPLLIGEARSFESIFKSI